MLTIELPLCYNYPGCSGPMLCNCQESKGHLCPNCQRSQDHLCLHHLGGLKLLALWPLGMLRPGRPLRPGHSKGNMAKPSETWRTKSSKRKAEAKLTSSLPVRPPYTPAQQSSKACWWLLITFCWGRHQCPSYSPYHKGPPQQSNILPQQLHLHQCPSNPLDPKDGILPQTLWTACLWAEPCPRQPQKSPQLQAARGPPWNKVLKQSHSEAFRQDTDLVKEARKEYFSKHSYNFTTEGTSDLLQVFKQMAKSAKLLGTSIHEIQAVWMGPDELRQANYALRSLPKGLKFLHAVPFSESPKVMGLVGIHD